MYSSRVSNSVSNRNFEDASHLAALFSLRTFFGKGYALVAQVLLFSVVVSCSLSYLWRKYFPQSNVYIET